MPATFVFTGGGNVPNVNNAHRRRGFFHLLRSAQKIPISVLAQYFVDLGRRLWIICRVLDLSPSSPWCHPEFILASANLLGRSAMPNVIAPAWKPHGYWQTI